MATPTKQYFVQLPGFEEGEVWDEGKFNRNKEQLYQDNPNAQVYETSAYLGGDVAEGDVFDVRLPGYEESERWDSAKLAKNREKLMADHPDVQITRMRPMKNWNPRGAQESLANIYARMDEINKQLAETPDDESSASDLRNMSDEDLVKAAANSQTTNAKTRRQLNRELEQLRAERDKNPMWQEYWEKTNSDIDASSKRIEQMRTNLDLNNPKSRRVSKFTGLTDRTGLGEMELRQDVKDNPEYYRDQEALLAAKTFYDDAKKIASAPSKYGDESGLANYWKGVTQNAGDALSVVALAKAMGNLPLIDAVQSIQEKEGKNVNIFDFSSKDMDSVDYLSKAQKEMVRAFVKRAEVEGGRSDNLSRGYQAGKSAIESVGFMADFLVAGGAGDAVASKAVGKLVENTAENSLARLGAESLYGLVKSAVMTPLMPSTYTNILNGIAQLDENGGMDLSGKVILKAGADAFIETASETIGAKPLELLGLAAKVPADWLEKTTFGAWGRVLREGPVFGFMKQAGWNGFFEEMFEEVSGNAVRAWTGVDKDALKNFMQPEQLLITAASFAPMSIIGGAASTARYGYVKKKYGTSLEEIQSRLAELDFTPEQIDHITDIGRMNSPEAVAKALKPAVDAMRTRGAFESDIKALMDYAYYASSMNVYDAFESERVQQERDAKRDELSQIYGDFWKGNEKDGRTVQRVTLPDGKTGFVQDTDETGLMTVKWDDGSVGFTDTEHGAQVEESTLDSYLDSQILLDTQARDAAQMQEDAAVARQQFSNNIAQNVDVPMGTPERQEVGKLALQTDPNTGATTPVRDANGNYVVITMNGQVPVSENDLAAKWGISLQPKTQEQKDADAVAAYEATKKRVDAYNAIPQGSVVEANLEGLDEPVQYQFTHAVMNDDTGEVEIKVWDAENQREETLPESAFPDLAQAAAEVSARQPEASAETPAEAPAETPAEDNTPRDFRGNPLPMKSDGRVDQGTLWSNDPEAWAAWNDQQRQDGGANSRAYIEGAKKDLEKDIKTLQKNYDAERDFDKRDAIEQQIAEKQQRLASLDNMLKGYETREKAAEEAAQAPVEETPAAPVEAPVEANEQPIVEAPVTEAQPSEEIGQPTAEEPAEPQVEAQPAQQPVLSPAEQRRIKRLYNRAKEWADKTGQDVVICSTYEDIPESQTVARMYARSGMPVYGWYDVSTEKVYVYLPDHADVAEIDKTFIHEVVSHRGLRGLLNDEKHPDGYDRLCDRVWSDIMNEEKRQQWLSYNFHLNVEDLRLDRMWRDMSEEDKARFNPNGENVDTPFLRNLYENVLTEEERARVDAANQLYLQRAAADEYIAHLSETTDLEDSRSIWQKFIDLVKEFLEEHGIEVKMTDADLQTLLRASLARYEAMAAEGETQTDLANKGVASNSQESRFSVRYVPTPEQAKQIAEDIHQQLGVSKTAAQRWVKSETSLAPIILDEHNSEFLDYIGDDRYAAIKKDSDYPQGTVDFNNICRKRLAFTQMYQRIQKAFPNRIITGEDLAKIRNIMKDHGLTVACGLCYVEDRRQLLGEIANGFIQDYKDGFRGYSQRKGSLDKPNDKGDLKNRQKVANEILNLIGEDSKDDLSVYDLLTLEGSEKLFQEHPGIFNAFQRYNSARGQQAGNLFQGYAEYKREILTWSKAKVRSVNNKGGLRVFSYSDFEAHHLIDLVQIIQDCARKGVMIQGYTKVPAFARAVANTNIKLNRSLIPLGDTGMVDGQLAFDPVEGIDMNDPDFLESNDNIGNILIGINDEQIALAMLDPRIHFIIPYHSNQSGVLRQMKQTGAWRNYKDEQTEKGMPGTDPNVAKKGVNIYTDVLAAAEAEGNPITNERQFTEKFLDVCREKGLVPRFARLLPQDENGNYLYRPGYYKLLVDFKLFDENGRILPQKPVVAEFDDAFNKKILEDYVRGEEDALGDNLDDVYNEIVDALGLEKRNAQSGTPRSGEDALNDIYKSIDRANEIRTRRATLESGLTTDGYSYGDKAVLDGYGLKAADLSRRDDVVTLHRLVAKKRNQGAGTQFMTDLTEMADKNDWVLALTPTKDLGASSVSRLKDFYKRFGFKENKGRNADLTVNESMIRQPEGSEIRFSIRGITGAQNADDQTALDNLAVATLMEDSGKDAETIWKATGWQKGADGKWREEIPDAKLKEGAELKKTQKAGDILDAPELFQSYPQLADIEVELKNTASAGAYNERYNKIVLDDEYNTDFELSAEDQKRVNEQTLEYINGGTWKRRSDVTKYKKNLLEKAGKKVLSKEGIKSLLHELQHAIQHIEGFATGGNAAQMEKEYYDEARKADAEKANFAWLFSRRNSVSRLRLVGRESIVRQMERFDISKYTDRDKELFANLLNRLKNMPEEEFGKFVRGADAIAKNAKKAGELGYNNLAGEVEARNVERRSKVSPESRRNTPLSASEDVPRRDQIIRFRVGNESQRIFVSNAEKAVSDLKMDKATPEQWKKTLEKNGGLKAAEDKWLGLSDWLDGLDRKTVTKQEVLDFIAKNQIQIEEQKYSEDVDLMREATEEVRNTIGRGKELEELQAEVDELVASEEYQNLPDDEAKDEWLLDQMKERYGDDFEMGYLIDEMQKIDYALQPWDIDEEEINSRIPVRKAESIRLGYTTEGLQNKAEIALTVPTIEPWNETDKIHFGDAGEGRAIAWARFGDTWTSKAKDDAKKAYYDAFKAYTDYKNEINAKYALQATGTKKVKDLATEEENAKVRELYLESQQKYHDWQFGQHPREKVLVIDEIQSKRHQEAREQGGYKDDSALKKAEKRRADAYDAYYGNVQRLQEKYGTEELRSKLTPEEELESQRLYMEYRDADRAVTRNGFDPMEDEEYRRLREEQQTHENNPEFQKLMEDWKNADEDARPAIIEQLRPLQERNRELIDAMEARERTLADEFNETHKSTIPAAPFEKNWHELAMKRMLRYAAENGYDTVAWTTGEQQAERYSLSKVVERVNVNPFKDGSRDVTIHLSSFDGEHKNMLVDENGVVTSGEYNGQKLSAIVGADLATKIMGAENREEFEGEDLKVGGEGMKGFYDDILPRFMNKYGKKWGVKVEDIELPLLGEDAAAGAQKGLTMHSVPVTEEMKESVMQGQTMFRKAIEEDEKESKELFDAAKERFGTTRDLREAGYVLPDGALLDFSGRHMVSGDSSFLNGRRSVDHRDIADLNFERDGNTPTGRNVSMADFISRGAIRIDGESGSVNLAVKPTDAQFSVIRRIAERTGGEMYIDFGANDTEHYAEYDGARPDRVVNDIRRYFDEGYMPAGNTMFRRVTPEQDAEYMEAVNSGDMDKAQQMVDEAAEAAGYTIRGYHGTTHDFTVFDQSKGNAEGNWGKGFYFTNNLDDAEANYANEDGADLTARIERLAEQMEWMDGYEDMDYDQRMEAAREQLAGENPHTISAAIRMSNPVVFNSRAVGPRETFFDFDSGYNPETDEYDGEESGLLLDFINAWEDVRADWDWLYGDYDSPTAILEYADGDGLTASQLEEKAREILAYVEDAEGNIATGEFLRQVFERMGFDGIVDHNVNIKFGTQRKFGRGMDGMDIGTVHAIAFQPNQIKQTDPVTRDDQGNVIPLSERFNPGNNDIRFRIAPMDEAEAEESAIRFRKVEDPAKIEELEAGEKIPGYRTVVLNPDGSMASPMAGELGVAKAKKSEDRRVKTSSFTENAWNEAEENPDLADENGKIKLIKTDNAKRGLVDLDEVDYNPYNHLRLSPVNLQFKDAWKRPDLIYIKSEVPKSEAIDLRGIKDPAEKDRLSPYHAEKAVLPVGIHDWSGGGELLLSRWDKPVGQVAWEEIADAWANDEKVKEGVQFDRVPPQILDMLVERGIEILPPSKGKDKNEAYKAWKAGDKEAYEAWRDTGKAPKQTAGETRFRTAYHGSGASFDRFDSSHMGKGEGVQAHGWGHYVAFDEGTSRRYAHVMGKASIDREFEKKAPSYYARELLTFLVDRMEVGDSFDTAMQNILGTLNRHEEARKKGELPDYWKNVSNQKDIEFFENLREEDVSIEGRRYLYTVEIPDDTGENYLEERGNTAKDKVKRIADTIRNVDKDVFASDTLFVRHLGRKRSSLSDEEQDEVLAKLRDYYADRLELKGKKYAKHPINDAGPTGRDIRETLVDFTGEEKAASKILHAAGFVGMKYDGRSDGPCAVIFDESDMKIVSQTRFRFADDAVKRVQDYGLRGVLDEDAAKAFWTDAFAVMPEEARREIVDKAFSSDADKQAIAERRYTREYIASLAKKGYAEDESGLLRYLADRLQAELGEELDENTLRYLIWRSANRYNSGIILNVAEDIALRRQLGVGEFSGDRFPSEAEQAVSEAENRIDSAEDEREASRRATRSVVRKTPYAALNAAMSGQRKYDQETVNSIVALAKDMIKKGDIDKVSAREMARLMTIIKDANGRRPATVKASALQLLDFMVDHTIGKEKELLEKMLKVRTAKVREPGVDTIAKLDLRTQNIINYFRDNYKLSEAEIDQAITELEDRMADGRRTDASLEDMRSQLEGLQLAKQYITEIYAKDADIRAVRQMMQASKEEFDGLTTEEKRQLRTARNEEIAADYEVIRGKKIEQVEAYRRLRGDLSKAINEGADRAQTFLEAERERVEQIHHWANSDMQGVSADVRDRQLTGLAKFSNSSFAKLFTAPLANLDQMLRTLGRKSPNGEGYLWKWMMGAVGKARNEEKLGLDAAEKKLNAKVREIFDEPGMSWNDIYAIERKMPKSKMSYFSANGEWVEEELTQGNLLYIYMVNKMSDGRMKLRQMNITEEDVDRIKKNLDPRFVELADWIQEEFLPGLRDRYNETHKRLFGTSMASIENYFPLRILGGVIEEKRNVGDQEAKALPSDITGAIIKRTVNTKQLNLAGTDAFSLVVEHVREMEHWNAYAEASRDFSTLLKYKRFQNQIKQLNTVYGAGKDLLNLLWDTVNLSVGAYRPVTSPSDKNALKIAKGVTAAKISFRAYTAIKQILSWPAFLADANTFILAKNTSPHNWAKNWKWAMENLPNFKKRVESRQAGIDILKDATFNEETWLADVERWITQNGMFMNAFVDALTVSIGAKSMYETKKARYLKEGFSEEQADEKAKFDAEVLFNETQQSSENEFMSTMQANRTVWNVMWTAYRNSSMGYQRQLHQGLRTLGRMARKGYKSESIAYMTKQLEREGLSPADAEKAAISRYERAGFQAAVRVAVFGWLVQFAWNLGSHAVYLLFGDDDDEKKSMFIEDATHALVGGAIEGLTMGNVISEALNMVKNGESLYNWDPTTLPIMSDIKSTISRMSSDPVAGLNDLVYLAVQIGLGTNPQTISDAIVAIYDACNGDVKMTKEAMICIMRILQVPQSQIDQFMIDEIGMSAKDARELSYEDIAKRYVDYKMKRNAPVTGPLYSDELREKREKSLNTTFKKKYNERQKLKEEE